MIDGDTDWAENVCETTKVFALGQQLLKFQMRWVDFLPVLMLDQSLVGLSHDILSERIK